MLKIVGYLNRISSNPFLHLIVLFLLLLLGTLGNLKLQVYCNPVIWARVILTITFLSTLIIPIFKIIKRQTPSWLFFIFGINTWVYLYLVLFIEFLNLFGILLFFLGIGVLILTPLFLLIYTVIHGIRANKFQRRWYISGLFAGILFVITSGTLYKLNANEIQAKNNSVSTYWEERILGMHFLYHTEFCEYDGWRPPLHDPMLVIGYRLNGKFDPIRLSLPNRIKLYKRKFPSNSVKLNCSCAEEYSSTYHNDKLWQTKSN